MKQDTKNDIKRVNVNVDQMQVFVIVNNIGKMINVDVNAKNSLTKVYVIKDLFEILAIVTVNLINHVMLVSIQTMKTVRAGKNQLKNVVKVLGSKNSWNGFI